MAAAKIPQTLLIPNFGVDLSSVSVMGVGEDGMTTFLYAEPGSLTTLLGMSLLY